MSTRLCPPAHPARLGYLIRSWRSLIADRSLEAGWILEIADRRPRPGVIKCKSFLELFLSLPLSLYIYKVPKQCLH